MAQRLDHHAYLYEGDPALLPEVERALRKEEGFAHDSPDVFSQHYEKFGVDDARELVSRSALKSSAGKALFLIAVGSITTEAQQALLKLFEEPQPGQVFVLIMPHGAILPTLRSRCLPLPAALVPAPSALHAGASRAREFLHQPHLARTEMIKTIVKEYEDDRGVAREFLSGLERELYERLDAQKPDAQIVQGLADIAQFRSYLSDRSPSVKMLLEHLAASLPKL